MNSQEMAVHKPRRQTSEETNPGHTLISDFILHCEKTQSAVLCFGSLGTSNTEGYRLPLYTGSPMVWSLT